MAALAMDSPSSAYFFTNGGTAPARGPSMSYSTSTCPSQCGPAPMPMVGMLSAAVTSRAASGGNRLQHDGERARRPRAPERP